MKNLTNNVEYEKEKHAFFVAEYINSLLPDIVEFKVLKEYISKDIKEKKKVLDYYYYVFYHKSRDSCKKDVSYFDVNMYLFEILSHEPVKDSIILLRRSEKIKKMVENLYDSGATRRDDAFQLLIDFYCGNILLRYQKKYTKDEKVKTEYIDVYEVIGELVSGDYHLAFHDKLKYNINMGIRTVLSFDRVKIITTDFISVVIGGLYKEFSPERIKKYLQVVDLQNDDMVLIKQIVDNAKKQYNRKKDGS